MRKDGGPAFPTTEQTCTGMFEGISKLDFFAAIASHALIRNKERNSLTTEEMDAIATKSYQMAQEMLKEREIHEP